MRGDQASRAASTAAVNKLLRHDIYVCIPKVLLYLGLHRRGAKRLGGPTVPSLDWPRRPPKRPKTTQALYETLTTLSGNVSTADVTTIYYWIQTVHRYSIPLQSYPTRISQVYAHDEKLIYVEDRFLGTARTTWNGLCLVYIRICGRHRFSGKVHTAVHLS